MARTKQSGRKSKQRNKDGQGPGDQAGDSRDSREERQKKNSDVATRRFTKFYKEIGLVPEEEWDKFISALKKPLPVTFRITGSRSQAKEVLKIIKGQYLSGLVNQEVEGRKLEPKCLSWYPGEMAWQLEFSRKEIRSNDLLKRLHDFLVSETESGFISRQEAVSMIPPLLMDIKPHHKILDMCAAPGSKTAQLIEFLHADESVPTPEGYVIANDSDNKRCYLMTHQVKRLQSPNFMILNHMAQNLPNIYSTQERKDGDLVRYDRILCDVPCSGDGTLRKNPDIWSKWSPASAFSMHGLQKKILSRGLELLDIGGRLVYSTCSMSPVEDEAVVVELLQRCCGAVELVDVSGEIPGLKYTPGLHTWKIMTHEEVWHPSYDEASKNFRKKHDSSIFPPVLAVAKALNLERCLRMLPHQQDSGGFFVAVFTKTRDLPWMKQRAEQEESTVNPTLLCPTVPPDGQNAPFGLGPGPVKGRQTGNVTVNVTEMEWEKTEEKVTEEGKKSLETTKEVVQVAPSTLVPAASTKRPHTGFEKKSLPPWKKQKTFGYKEDPFLFMEKDLPEWPMMKKFFHLKDSFPTEQLMFRSEGGKPRTLYFVSSEIKNLAISNCDKIKVINMGLKAFSRGPSPLVPDCDFRLSQESMANLHKYFEERRINLTKEDVVTIMTQENPFFVRLSETAQADLDRITPGSVIFHFQPSESDKEPECEIVFCGWRGKTSVRSFVAKNERSHYLRLCGLELTDIQKKIEEMKKEREESANKDENVPALSDDESCSVEENGKGKERDSLVFAVEKEGEEEESTSQEETAEAVEDSSDKKEEVAPDQTSGEAAAAGENTAIASTKEGSDAGENDQQQEEVAQEATDNATGNNEGSSTG